MSKFADIFRENGINITPSRMAIFEVIEKNDKHLTIEEIFDKAKKKDAKIGMATVYRTMNLLCELSLVVKHEFDNCNTVYEKNHTGAGHHHHIVDIENRNIVEFIDQEIDKILEKIAKNHGYKMLGHKLEIYGKKEK